jgi:putative membrane protein
VRQGAREQLLLSTMQVSLNLIGFGFTIYEIFSSAAEKTGLVRVSVMASRVGISLLTLGLILLSGGLWGHRRTRRQLRERRAQLIARGIAVAPRDPLSPVFGVGCLLLLVGFAILGAIGVHLFR